MFGNKRPLANESIFLAGMGDRPSRIYAFSFLYLSCLKGIAIRNGFLI
jgi:hypothetical protein